MGCLGCSRQPIYFEGGGVFFTSFVVGCCEGLFVLSERGVEEMLCLKYGSALF